MQQMASLRYVGMRLLNRYWPAVSHSWSLQVVLLWTTFLPRKSIPMVGYHKLDAYIFLFLVFIIHKSFDDACFAGIGVAKENDFECPLADGRTRYGHGFKNN